MHGVTPEEVLANAALLYDQLHEEDRPRVSAPEERSRRDGSAFELELRSHSRHGLRWVSSRKKSGRA